MTFWVEDNLHAEVCGEFPTLEAAVAELRRRMAIPWDEEPNRAPCMSWRTCGREYQIVEYDGDRLVGRSQPALNISADAVEWAP